MKILGIDPALSITGYGLINVDKKEILLLEAGVIRSLAKQPTSRRLSRIYRGLRELILEFKPDVMVLEKLYVHQHHPVTAFLLGHARGVICLAAAEADIPVVEYAATRIKKAITGSGAASKHQIQRMVSELLNLKQIPKYNDVTDALALAIAHNNIMKF